MCHDSIGLVALKYALLSVDFVTHFIVGAFGLYGCVIVIVGSRRFVVVQVDFARLEFGYRCHFVGGESLSFSLVALNPYEVDFNHLQ